ncbi:hypothetical protein CWI38_0139p0050 [Hamiltosporidium tvaerminnensis]|uniref:Reverse transcriptase n=1 Tax=Hamiltosporidium tvaerminnensis TaxID=1176355 RepID=A0A4Q9M2Z1_9MICR|nr:hypothetical protein CWI38_0139p0050 [Hamiltosporidium tvaerminnensis]
MIVYHLAARCEKMQVLGYTRRHNEVFSKRIRSHSVQEILDNEYAEIRVDTRIKNDVKIRNNRPDIFILDKKKNKITLIEVGITFQDLLQIVETEKLRKYDLLANELGLIYKCSVEIIPYVMTWDGIVTKYYKTYSEPNTEESWVRASMSVIMRAYMLTMLEEPTININEESDLEEETSVV